MAVFVTFGGDSKHVSPNCPLKGKVKGKTGMWLKCTNICRSTPQIAMKNAVLIEGVKPRATAAKATRRSISPAIKWIAQLFGVDFNFTKLTQNAMRNFASQKLTIKSTSKST